MRSPITWFCVLTTMPKPWKIHIEAWNNPQDGSLQGLFSSDSWNLSTDVIVEVNNTARSSTVDENLLGQFGRFYEMLPRARSRDMNRKPAGDRDHVTRVFRSVSSPQIVCGARERGIEPQGRLCRLQKLERRSNHGGAERGGGRQRRRKERKKRRKTPANRVAVLEPHRRLRGHALRAKASKIPEDICAVCRGRKSQ